MRIGPLLLCSTIAPALLLPQTAYHPAIPKVWDEAQLAEWATPVAGLKLRPTHIAQIQMRGRLCVFARREDNRR